MFSTFREYCLLPEKQMCDDAHCSFMHTFEETTLLSSQRERRTLIIWAKFNFISYLHSILFINVTITDQNYGLYIVLQPPYLQSYADAVAGKGAPLYNCFDYVGGTIARICRTVLYERVVYSHDTRVHGAKSQTVVLPNGLIINLEGQWEGRRHECVLFFMNRVY